ncbi:MAG: hypothetical protein Q7T97_16670 [Burkholderiaceae bacterium]|nr:hypothetical protein [Burkholderiaceae bacterium]
MAGTITKAKAAAPPHGATWLVAGSVRDTFDFGRPLATSVGGAYGLFEGPLVIAANWRCRPKPACRVAPKRPHGEPSLFLFRFYKAAARDLTHPAMTGRTDIRKTVSPPTGLRGAAEVARHPVATA